MGLHAPSMVPSTVPCQGGEHHPPLGAPLGRFPWAYTSISIDLQPPSDPAPTAGHTSAENQATPPLGMHKYMGAPDVVRRSGLPASMTMPCQGSNC